MSDQQLIERVASAEQAAFAELVRRYLAALVKFSTRYSLSFSCSEDIVQEALLRVWRHAGSWCASKGSVKSWLFKIVYNATIDYLRKKQRHAETVGGDPDTTHSADHPDDALLQRQQKQWLQQALAALPERQRSALCLSMNNGLSVAEVASVLGLSVDATGSLLARAKRGLKNKMLQDRSTGACL